MRRLEEVVAKLDARCREPLKITWEEPLALAAPRTASWESTQPGRVGSLSVSGDLHNNSGVESEPLADLAIFPLSTVAGGSSNTRSTLIYRISFFSLK